MGFMRILIRCVLYLLGTSWVLAAHAASPETVRNGPETDALGREKNMETYLQKVDAAMRDVARAEDLRAELRGWQAATVGLIAGALVFSLMQWRGRSHAQRSAVRLTEENAALRRECEKARRDAHVRGEYVSRFLDLSLDETYRLEQLKSTVLLKLQAGDTERLKKLMRDPEFPDHFRGHCLHRFDIAFQRLYPGFAEAVNRLLLPEERIELPENEVLNNDLRVLAFMCLGITDSQKIAAILGVSVNTVYFYRNKLRRKALRRETFEREVVDIVAAAVPTTRPV